MTQLGERKSARVESAWERFWFAPTPTSTLAVVRIAYAAVVLTWCALISFDILAFFSTEGLLAERVSSGPWTWSLLDIFSSDPAVLALFALLVMAACCVLVGFHTRLATLMTFVLLISFERRNLVVLNSADTLLRLFGLYLVFAPAGAALSVDRWRSAPHRFWEFPERAAWALRLVQIQVSVMYLFTVWLKVHGETWNNGTAISYALRVMEVVRFNIPAWITQSALLSSVLTYATLAIELALALLIWNRRARPWVIAAGVVLHLSILGFIRVGLFSVTVFVGYLAFVPPATMTALLMRARLHMRRSSFAALRRLASAGPDTGYQPQLPLSPPVPHSVPAAARAGSAGDLSSRD